MQHRATFNLMVGTALVTQFEVMAEIFKDSTGDWYVSAVYVDVMEIDGRSSNTSRDWVEIPKGDRLHHEVMQHFYVKCADAISERWGRHAWRYMPPRSLISAGREM